MAADGKNKTGSEGGLDAQGNPVVDSKENIATSVATDVQQHPAATQAPGAASSQQEEAAVASAAGQPSTDLDELFGTKSKDLSPAGQSSTDLDELFGTKSKDLSPAGQSSTDLDELFGTKSKDSSPAGQPSTDLDELFGTKSKDSSPAGQPSTDLDKLFDAKSKEPTSPDQQEAASSDLATQPNTEASSVAAEQPTTVASPEGAEQQVGREAAVPIESPAEGADPTQTPSDSVTKDRDPAYSTDSQREEELQKEYSEYIKQLSDEHPLTVKYKEALLHQKPLKELKEYENSNKYKEDWKSYFTAKKDRLESMDKMINTFLQFPDLHGPVKDSVYEDRNKIADELSKDFNNTRGVPKNLAPKLDRASGADPKRSDGQAPLRDGVPDVNPPRGPAASADPKDQGLDPKLQGKPNFGAASQPNASAGLSQAYPQPDVVEGTVVRPATKGRIPTFAKFLIAFVFIGFVLGTFGLGAAAIGVVSVGIVYRKEIKNFIVNVAGKIKDFVVNVARKFVNGVVKMQNHLGKEIRDKFPDKRREHNEQEVEKSATERREDQQVQKPATGPGFQDLHARPQDKEKSQGVTKRGGFTLPPTEAAPAQPQTRTQGQVTQGVAQSAQPEQPQTRTQGQGAQGVAQSAQPAQPQTWTQGQGAQGAAQSTQPPQPQTRTQGQGTERAGQRQFISRQSSNSPDQPPGSIPAGSVRRKHERGEEVGTFSPDSTPPHKQGSRAQGNGRG